MDLKLIVVIAVIVLGLFVQLTNSHWSRLSGQVDGTTWQDANDLDAFFLELDKGFTTLRQDRKCTDDEFNFTFDITKGVGGNFEGHGDTAQTISRSNLDPVGVLNAAKSDQSLAKELRRGLWGGNRRGDGTCDLFTATGADIKMSLISMAEGFRISHPELSPDSKLVFNRVQIAGFDFQHDFNRPHLFLMLTSPATNGSAVKVCKEINRRQSLPDPVALFNSGTREKDQLAYDGTRPVCMQGEQSITIFYVIGYKAFKTILDEAKSGIKDDLIKEGYTQIK